MKWFKFYGVEYLSDPKMLTLTACERSCWITLLSYASVSDEVSETGFVKHMDEHTLMVQAGVDFKEDEWDRTAGVLERFEKLGMITNDNGVITLEKWLKRQETNLTGYERVKRHRIKKRNDNANDNAKITIEKSRVDKIRVDKSNTNTKSSNKLLPQVEEVILKYIPIRDIKNKTNQSYLKRLYDYFEQDLKQVELLCRGYEFFQKSEYPYVIFSLRALYEKREKIMARLKQEQLKVTNKKSKWAII